VAAVICSGEDVLLTRRLRGTHLEGLWEFPGGKLEAGESHEAALHREIQEELDAGVRVHEQLLTTTHAYPDRAVALHFYRCTLTTTPRAVLGQEMRWVDRARLNEFAFPPADRELVLLLTGAQGTWPPGN
jgi:mutator protein MutT